MSCTFAWNAQRSPSKTLKILPIVRTAITLWWVAAQAAPERTPSANASWSKKPLTHGAAMCEATLHTIAANKFQSIALTERRALLAARIFKATAAARTRR